MPVFKTSEAQVHLPEQRDERDHARRSGMTPSWANGALLKAPRRLHYCVQSPFLALVAVDPLFGTEEVVQPRPLTRGDLQLRKLVRIVL